MHGGIKFYRGAAKAARAYVESDHSRADDYYLAEGSGLAQRLVATPDGVTRMADMDGDEFESWVAGIDLATGKSKGRLRQDANALRYVEVTVNGPKTWSLAAALHPDISVALDAAQERAAEQIVAFVAQHATTRVGPRGRQVQVPVEQIEAAVIRHYTSRAGDPHRHLHLQINARVWAEGKWRGLHSVGVRDMIEAVNGVGHAAVATDPEFRAVLANHGLTLDAMTGEIAQLAPFAGAFSARTSQIQRNIDRYEAEWRREHSGEEPGPKLQEIWDRRAWADARPDKVAPASGADLVARWNAELGDLGYRDPTGPVEVESTQVGWINRDGTAEWALSQLSAKRSAWNAADIRGRVEVLLAEANVVAESAARIELAEDITARAVARCTPLLASPEDVPEHVRALTSDAVLAVEADIVRRLARRGEQPAKRARATTRGLVRIDPTQAAVVGALAGDGRLVVVEGAAGAGKTTALRATQELLAVFGQRLVVVTPTLKAAEVAAAETGAEGRSAAWLIHQYGWRWDGEGHWARKPDAQPVAAAQLRPDDLLLVDEAGMLDQDTARSLLTIADETGARIALVGDRHQLPAVGRGGLLDHAVAWAHPSAVVTLEKVHRFVDPDYAALSLKMRKGDHPEAVFDALHRRGQIVVHASDLERDTALAVVGAAGDLVVADTREQVASLNASIREQRQGTASDGAMVTPRGEQIGLGDRVATRRNNAELGVSNRQTWTVTHVGRDGSLTLRSKGRDRVIPAEYAAKFVELAYATTIHGAQGETVDRAHVAIGDASGAAAAYVAMTRGRHSNTAHIVAETVEDARKQWAELFSRDRADLGPAHAKQQALDAVHRYGTKKRRRPAQPLPESRRQTLYGEFGSRGGISF
jgi:conjugative relaxase-like TrwC/TraI family protein